MLARHRGMSISQAIEFALAKVLSEYGIGDRSVESWVQGMPTMKRPGKGAKAKASPEVLAELALECEQLFVMLIPDELRTPDERFFIELWTRAVRERPDVTAEVSINSDLVGQLLSESRIAFRRGIDGDDVLRQWLELAEGLRDLRK